MGEHTELRRSITTDNEIMPIFNGNEVAIVLWGNIPSHRRFVARIFQILSAPAGYEEKVSGLKPIRNRELF